MESTTRPYYMHIVGEITNLDELLLSYKSINDNFSYILQKLGINIIKSDYHEFPGGGLSLVYILSASHLAIHTWPELGYLHLDLITCSPETDIKRLNSELGEKYKGLDIEVKQVQY